jgi:hypothetical protein
MFTGKNFEYIVTTFFYLCHTIPKGYVFVTLSFKTFFENLMRKEYEVLSLMEIVLSHSCIRRSQFLWFILLL